MKKGIFAILAMLAVFAMISCGGGGGGSSSSKPKGEKVKITFDLNDGVGDAAGTVYKTVTIGKGEALGNNYPEDPVLEGYEFLEWNDEKDGDGNFINGNSKFAEDTIVYAMKTTYNAATQVKVTFDYGEGFFPRQIKRIFDTGNVIPNFPDAPVKNDYQFRGWWSDDATPVRVTSYGSIMADTNATALWIGATVKPALKDDEVRFVYENNDWQDIVFNPGVTTWGDVKAQLVRGTDMSTNHAKAFSGIWKDSSDAQWGKDTTANNTAVTASTTYTAVWWNGALTETTGALEKVYSENGITPVYKFDLGDGITITQENLAKIKSIKASYVVSEAAFNILKEQKSNITYRYFGPYIASDEGIKPTAGGVTSTQTWYGDFMATDNNNLIARWDGSNSNPGEFKNGTFNKFHSYFIVNGGNFVDGAAYKPISTGSEYNYDKFTAENTWLDSEIHLNNVIPDEGKNNVYTYGNALKQLEGVLTNGKDGDVQVVPEEALDTTVIYFGIGISRRNGGNDKGTESGTRSPWQCGIIYAVKNVKLWIDLNDNDTVDDGELIDGTIPELPFGDDGTKTKQVFTGYAPGDLNYAWRGAVDAAVVITQGADYVAPQTVPPALNAYSVKKPTLSLYQNDAGKNDTDGQARKRITLEGNKITFDLDENDYNNTGGRFGGGGFKIVFDNIYLPEDYRAYKVIILDCTVAETSAGTMFGNDTESDALKNPRQLIFSSIGGADATAVVNNTASGAQYVNLVDGEDEGKNIFKIPVGNLTLQSEVGLAARTNNWSGGLTGADIEKNNVPFKGTLTVNKIKFSTSY